ncbi:MAG: DNA internalization-related competence protein ComEC/Rec2, partial [Bacteroidota bacterium]
GVVHVLSVSGLHVGYVVLIFLVVFNRFNMFTRYTLTFFGLLFYLILTGADSPVFRSTVMAFALLAAPATGREYNSLNSLSLSALVILLINPKEMFNPSFQLSFSAILSLILIYPPMKKFVEGLNIRPNALKWFALFSVTSIAAQLGTLPFTLTYFHRLSISALFANIIVIPVSGAIVGLGILTVAIGAISNFLGIVFGSASELLTYFMYWCVQLLGNKSFSYISFNQFSAYDAVIFYLAIITVGYIIKTFTNVRAKAVASVLTVMLMLVLMRLDNYELMPRNELSMMTVDVGQGNAVLVKFPNGETALIDAGNSTAYFDNGERVIIPLLDRLGIDQIDYGIVSHIDSDHSGGFISLVKNHRVKQILKPEADTSSFLERDFEKLLKGYDVPFKYFSKEKFAIGNARLYVLNDTLNYYPQPVSSNDKSGIVKIVYGKSSILLTGDASIRIEENYLNDYGKFLASDVLLVGHHGSRTSTGDQFLAQVHPSFAVISAGVMNKFKHPHQETIQKLDQAEIKVLRTDKHGAILLCSDGEKINQIDWHLRETKIQL